MGDELEDRRKLRSVWAWILLVGVYSILSGAILVPLHLKGIATWSFQLGVSIVLGMLGILLLLRLTSEILDYRRRRCGLI